MAAFGWCLDRKHSACPGEIVRRSGATPEDHTVLSCTCSCHTQHQEEKEA